MNFASIVTGGVVGSRPNTLLPNTQHEIASNAPAIGIGDGGGIDERAQGRPVVRRASGPFHLVRPQRRDGRTRRAARQHASRANDADSGHASFKIAFHGYSHGGHYTIIAMCRPPCATQRLASAHAKRNRRNALPRSAKPPTPGDTAPDTTRINPARALPKPLAGLTSNPSRGFRPRACGVSSKGLVGFDRLVSEVFAPGGGGSAGRRP